MKKLLMVVLLFTLAVPSVMAESIIVKKVMYAPVLEEFAELPSPSQKLVNVFLDNLLKGVKETKLKEAVLPKSVEDTEAIDAILPFITGVKQDYYMLADKDAQAARFVGKLLYTSRFSVKEGSLSIPDFIVRYRSYIETHTDLDAFYNDIFKDVEESQE